MDHQSLLSGYQGFDVLYGLQILDCGEESVRAQVPVVEKIRQPFGLVHGGVIAAISEALASAGTAVAVLSEGNAPLGLSNQTSFLRPIAEGTVHAVATRRHRGRTTWVWDVEICDDAGRVCALSRMTIAVRPRRAEPADAASPDSG